MSGTSAVKNNLVAIVGRPNVGKSTLFNRFYGKRKAIVQKEEGTTRDVIKANISWNDKKMVLMDTGGINFSDKDLIQTQVQKQVDIALREAGIILFVVDFQAGMTALDLRVADKIRKEGKDKTFLVVNKVDDFKSKHRVNEFYELGFERQLWISALHNTGMDDLLDEITQLLPADPLPGSPPQPEHDLSLGIVGEPNVGKSTYFNKLVLTERSIVTNIPGTTRDPVDEIILCKGKRIRLVDTAGYFARKKVKDPSSFFGLSRTREAIQESDVVLLFFDAERGFQAASRMIAKLINDTGKPVVLVGNKWDLVKSSKREYEEALKAKVGFLDDLPFEPVSGLNRINIGRPLEKAVALWEASKTRVAARDLNEFMKKLSISSRMPPAVKINLILQTGSRPPSFTIFAKNSHRMLENFQAYIRKQLIAKYGLQGIPIRLRIKETPK